MKKRTKYALLIGILLAVFGLARLYGAYQNERRRALSIEAQFTRWASQLDCSLKWATHKAYVSMMASNEELKRTEPKLAEDLENQLKSGHLYSPVEPTCHLEDEDPLMPQRINVKGMQAIAAAAHRYAFDRGRQTLHILRNTWAAVTGQPSVSTDEEVAHLAK